MGRLTDNQRNALKDMSTLPRTAGKDKEITQAVEGLIRRNAPMRTGILNVVNRMGLESLSKIATSYKRGRQLEMNARNRNTNPNPAMKLALLSAGFSLGDTDE